jgi:hypothetical protein
MTDDSANKMKDAVMHYEAQQIVCYKSNGKRSKAQVVKKHLDDELEPFYTIVLPWGKEKQTDSAHLETLDPAFERIEEKLLSMSAAELQQVESFLSSGLSVPLAKETGLPPLPSMKSLSPVPPPSMGNSNAMTPASAPTSMMNGASANASSTSIPSPLPDPKAISGMGGIPAPNIANSTTNPQQQQPPPQMQGQMQGQNPAPQMMMQQQQQLPQMGQFQQQPPHMQGQVGGQPQMMMMQQQPMPGQQLPQMQGQMGGPPQMMMQQQQQQSMQGQPQIMMQQQPMPGQNPPQMGGAAPQGNPFDMY